MPTYVYQCSTCDHTFEVEQRITADPLHDCDCGAKNSLKRLIQPIAVMFKGSGFHINDYSSTKAETKEEKPVEAASKEPSGAVNADKTPEKAGETTASTTATTETKSTEAASSSTASV